MTTSHRHEPTQQLVPSSKVFRAAQKFLEGFRAKNPPKTGSERMDSERVNHQRLMFTQPKTAFATL
jgi:hypothetical protein